MGKKGRRTKKRHSVKNQIKVRRITKKRTNYKKKTTENNSKKGNFFTRLFKTKPKKNKEKKIIQPKKNISYPKIIKDKNNKHKLLEIKSFNEKENEELMTSFFAATKKQKEEKLQAKEKRNKYIEQENKIKEGNKKRAKLIIFIIIVTVGSVMCYLFPNIFVYSSATLVVLYSALLTFYKKKVKKPVEENSKKKLKPIDMSSYKTEFDKFYEYIKINRKVDVAKLAKKFKIPKKQAESWAEILEQHKLIKIYYPLFGDQQLECLE